MIRMSGIKLELPTGEVFIANGAHHDDCEENIKELKDKWQEARQTKGFILHNGDFIDEKEAFKYAFDIGQLPLALYMLKKDGNDEVLRSEEIF